MNSRVTIFSVVLMAGLLAVTSCYAAPKLEIGAKAPDFSGVGVDDKEYELGSFQAAKVIVLVFTCNNCPVAKAYEDRLLQLQEDYKSKDIQIVALCVNDSEGDRLPGMKKRAEEKGFNFPYIYDASQDSARAYGATCTPHVFLLNQNRKIVYQGVIDDSNKPEKVDKKFLRDAIDAVLAGKEVPEKVTNQRGCGIKWSKK